MSGPVVDPGNESCAILTANPLIAMCCLDLARPSSRPNRLRAFVIASLLAATALPGQEPAGGTNPQARLRGPQDAARLAAKAERLQQAVRKHRTLDARHRQAKRERIARDPLLAGRLESRLLDAIDRAADAGAAPALAFLKASGVAVRDDKVPVLVECGPAAAPADVAAMLVAHNATVVRTGDRHVKALVPVTALGDVAGRIPGVSYVRTPIRKKLSNVVATEGRAVAAAVPWHTAGVRGQGVKVAVIDYGFAGLAERKAADEIPASAIAVDFTGEGMASGGNHGCACAEILYDMAPGCQLYLLNAADMSDDEAAKNYCKAQGIQIVSVSSGYDTVNFYDGVAYSSISPHPVAVVNDAAANGILWVAAAGNYKRQHALTAWRDVDKDNCLDWDYDAGYYYGWNPLFEADGATVPVNTVITGELTWNKWPVTNQDFDLELWYWDGTDWQLRASGADTQSGTQPPCESLAYTVTAANTLVEGYAFFVYKYSATTSPTFILRTGPYEPFYYGYTNFETPAPGSISCPADAASCFAVGAIDAANYASGPLESYSSLGPNNGAYTGNPALVKPDVCGPTWVSTVTYGTTDFGGTSASVPHIAGLAALVKQAYPTYNHTALRTYLEGRGVDLGSAGKDNSFGAGPVVLPTSVPLTPLQAWRQTHFGSSANSGDGADMNDFDKDGLPNLIEFGFGLDPRQNSAGQLPELQRSGESITVTFTEPAGAGGITYGAESSETLLPGSWTAVADTGSGTQHTFSVPAGAKPKLFLRLRVTNPDGR